MSGEEITYQKKELPANLSKIGIALLFVGAVFGVIAFFTDHTRASFNYLIAYSFMISIGVGSLFLVALEYAAGAVWSVPIRRVVEFFAATIPFLAILVIPLLFNMHDLFHWSH
jgi:hypothetical protein